MTAALRRAGPQDRGAIEAFLSAHMARSMFPLANLARHGMAGGDPRAMHFWIEDGPHGPTGVLGQTEMGTVLPQLPRGDFRGVPAALAGRPVAGIIGPADQARGIEAALDLSRRDCLLAQDEPHFLLSLDRLAMPNGPGRLMPLAKAPRQVILEWMLDYQIRTLHAPALRARALAEDAYGRFCREASHAVLMDGARPLAMTGFNARLPRMVQVGGVYTPPDLRGRGHARRAVALHLAQAHAEGATEATLFASGPAAVRAYEAIGFQRIGDWTLMLFDTEAGGKP